MGSNTDSEWRKDILSVLKKLEKREFSNEDLYVFEKDFQARHPENQHIQDKVRQELQKLRDEGIVNHIAPGQWEFIGGMNYWIFIVTARDGISAREIFDQRMKDMFWGLGRGTPNRKSLKKDDKVVFYIGWPECVFAGVSTLDSSCFEQSSKEKTDRSHGQKCFEADFGVTLRDIFPLVEPRSARNLAASLGFIANKSHWGTYFQGGIRGIMHGDYETIISPGPMEHVRSQDEPVQPNNQQFALEAHLEDFIDENWNETGWGTNLVLYQDGEVSGRQFPAGTWSIDFLAIDKKTNDLVVVELKKVQTSDTTVGQVLRYIGWVKENIAKPGQKVRGLIVCPALDEALKYAVKYLPDVVVFTYEVSFSVKKVDLES